MKKPQAKRPVSPERKQAILNDLLAAKRQARDFMSPNVPTPAVKNKRAKGLLSPTQKVRAPRQAKVISSSRLPTPAVKKQHARQLLPSTPKMRAKRQAVRPSTPSRIEPALNRADHYIDDSQAYIVGTERQANKGAPSAITLPAAESDSTDQATSDPLELSVGGKKRDEADETGTSTSPNQNVPRRVKRPRAKSATPPSRGMPVDTEPQADKPEQSTDRLPADEQAGITVSNTKALPAPEPSADPTESPFGQSLAALKKLAVVHAHLTKAITRDINHVKAVARSIVDKEQAEYIQGILMERTKLLRPHKEQNARYIERAVRQMPIHEWVAGIPGAGMVNVGLILGHTGDPAQYANPAKLWKRMGLGIMPDGETRQKRFTDPELALIAGYSPRRRSIMWVLGDCLLKQNYNDAAHEYPGYYRALFEERFIYELGKLGVARDQYDAKIKTHTHAKAKAKRYMEKRFLLHLWRQFRKHTEDDNGTNGNTNGTS